MTHPNSFGSRSTLDVAGRPYTIFRLDSLSKLADGNAGRLPFSLKILLENLLRNEDGKFVKPDDVRALATWDMKGKVEKEIAFRTARVLLQDFTGVPAVVDLAAMRDALARLGGDARQINPLQPVDLVIDHSVQVDEYGSEAAFLINADFEFQRNQERYAFLRWGQKALHNFRVVPPDTGIVHQINLEYLAQGVFTEVVGKQTFAYPDSLVGTDSHTTMINGLGVLGWGVGGIEAEAAMLGQPVSMLIPEVVGFKLHGKLPPGATATDLVLTVTEMLRKKKVVGKFVEFYGAGLSSLSLADRATIANMAPEYGATMGFFPGRRRDDQLSALHGARRGAGAARRSVHARRRVSSAPTTRRSGLQRHARARPRNRGAESRGPEAPAGSRAAQARQDDVRAMSRRTGTVAGSRRQSRRCRFRQPQLSPSVATRTTGGRIAVPVTMNGQSFQLRHGAVVIAAITSCTNTSNPSVMLAAGLAREERGGEGSQDQAVGEDESRPGLEGRHRLFQESWRDGRSRGARLQRRRIRMHDVHR